MSYQLYNIHFIHVHRLRTDFEDIQNKEEANNDGVLRVTSTMMRTVYLEIKRNIPFESHKLIVLQQEMHGVDMGFNHRKKCGAVRITTAQSILSRLPKLIHESGCTTKTFKIRTWTELRAKKTRTDKPYTMGFRFISKSKRRYKEHN